MKRLLFVFASMIAAVAAPAQAQSRFDVCEAYARDAMMQFYSSSAVPAPRAVRAREAPYKSPLSNERRGSLRSYFHQCWARRL